MVATTRKIVSNNRAFGHSQSNYGNGQNLQQAQEYIYSFLLNAVKTWPASDVLAEFRQLFIDHSDTTSPNGLSALQIILFANNEQEFKNTLKRCCYILINNWEMSRQHEAVQELVELFKSPCIYRRSLSPTLKRLRQWLINFIDSPDYRELELFALRLREDRTINRGDNWAIRYTPYLLVPQYMNNKNPVEQRQAARAMARRLKDKFKFDLAMYTAYSDSPRPQQMTDNPTELGDGALRLIKMVVAKQGLFGYRNLSRLFLTQVDTLSYREFKRHLLGYLIYVVKTDPLAEQIKARLWEKLEGLYIEHDDEPVDQSMLLRTCDRLIDCLMTENHETPAEIFTLLLSQNNSVTLAIILLKLVLISPSSQAYLEARIADLITYYDQFPRQDCQWVIHFLEVFRVVFTLYTDDVEYNLVKVSTEKPAGEAVASHSVSTLPTWEELESFRIFAQSYQLAKQKLKPSKLADQNIFPSQADPSQTDAFPEALSSEASPKESDASTQA
ncbi:hypothetical protein C7271_09725 [filamentous cyanobacterium CCP5]|nr:hypothetical protein C7271_09725 [filamentous cyanobacterium CCP5]